MNNNQSKGITLVALVITIIVLIILAGVSINAVMNGGLITNAKDAKNEYEVGKKEEERNLERLTIDPIEIEFISKGVPYKFKNGYLTGIEVNNGLTETVGSLKGKLPTEYKIYDNLGKEEASDEENAATGMIIKKNDKIIGRVIVFGDINGETITDQPDGNIRSDGYPDYASIAELLRESGFEFEEYQLMAMDVDHNNIIDQYDVDKASTLFEYDIQQNEYIIDKTRFVIDTFPKAREKYLSTFKAKNTGYTIEKSDSGYIMHGQNTNVSEILKALQVENYDINITYYNDDEGETFEIVDGTISETYTITVSYKTRDLLYIKFSFE